MPQALAARLLIGLVGALALTGAGYLAGYDRAQDAAAAAQLEAEREAAQALEAERQRGEDLSRQLAEAKQQTRIEYRTIRQEVPRVVVKYVPAPGAEPEPVSCPITVGFVGLWDRALAAGLSGAAGGAADPAAGADPLAGLRLSGLELGDVLANHVDNAEQCSEIRAQLNALIDWHEGRR